MDVAAVGLASGASAEGVSQAEFASKASGTHRERGSSPVKSRSFNGAYESEGLAQIAFPLGGIGAGMICLEGTAAVSKFSLWHGPNLINEPLVFAALSVPSENFARVLEGPVPGRKKFPNFLLHEDIQSLWGLPRFQSASFEARFPFGTVELEDDHSPLTARIIGWSPFEPGDEDDASLPTAALEYVFTSRLTTQFDAVFSFHAANIMAAGTGGRIRSLPGGFVLDGSLKGKPWTLGSFAIAADDPTVRVNHAWFRGPVGTRPLVWRDIEGAACYDRAPLSETEEGAPGASLFVPFTIEPGESKRIIIRLAWYVPQSNLRLFGGGLPDAKPATNHETLQSPPGDENYRPWYVSRFSNVESVMSDWSSRYTRLRERSERFTQSFYSSTLPPEVLEAVAANLTILKSPTVLRQADGKFWAWEGSAEHVGAGDGTCAHVWNYAQALPHLFPRLERSIRETEFDANQNAEGHQAMRAALPIRATPHKSYAAADGQLGGILKTYRDWRVGGDTTWVRSLWPKIRDSLDYCIRTWDPRHTGLVEEPHHNTYDIEFWGADGMCSSIYLGALKAAVAMGQALNEDTSDYAALLEKGILRMESELFNGEFFHQRVVWKGLNASYPEDDQSMWGKARFPEEVALAEREGPAHQYSLGCLSDGVIGAWMSWVCGLGHGLSRDKVSNHLDAVYRYNFKSDLTECSNPTFSTARATYALGNEGGLLLCTWPHGGRPSLPFAYATEVWTGIEYQVASHLISIGKVEEGLNIVKACRRRYDGRWRNPFSELEAGHWYARAMSSYALLQAFSGARYDAVDKVLHLSPAVPGDFRCFLSTATGYGAVGVRNSQPFVEISSGSIPIVSIEYTPSSRVSGEDSNGAGI